MYKLEAEKTCMHNNSYFIFVVQKNEILIYVQDIFHYLQKYKYAELRY